MFLGRSLVISETSAAFSCSNHQCILRSTRGRLGSCGGTGSVRFPPEDTQGSSSPHGATRPPALPSRPFPPPRGVLGAGCPPRACRAARALPWAPAGGGARGPRGGAILEWRRAAAAPCPVPLSVSLPLLPRPVPSRPRPLRSMSVVEHVREMAAAGLHSNVRLLSGLLLTMSGNNP